MTKRAKLGFFVALFLLVSLIVSIVLLVKVNNRINVRNHVYENHVYDEIDIIGEDEVLNDALDEVYKNHQLNLVVSTVFDEDWNEDYETLEDYAYDAFVEMFADSSGRNALIVYSIPESQADAWRSGQLQIPDFSYELMQNSRADRVLNNSVDRVLINSIYEHLENGDDPGVAIAAAIDEAL